MAKPAARLGDNHVCPRKTSKVPHVGGPAISGSSNVFINGLPAAKKGDNLVCVGPMDTITEGSSSVFINGKPAARMGDGSSHKGKIVAGSGNVFIGNKGQSASGGVDALAANGKDKHSKKDTPSKVTSSENSTHSSNSLSPSDTGTSSESSQPSKKPIRSKPTQQDNPLPSENELVSIIPVRYAYDTELLAPRTTGNFSKGPFNTQIPYTLRQLRDGWLYIYNSTTKRIEEYQVEGSNIGGKSCLSYPKGNNIKLAYSFQQWTDRIKQSITTNRSLRARWMRNVRCDGNNSTHCGDLDTLATTVADMQGNPVHDFSNSSTPLTENTSTNTVDNTESDLIRAKPATSPDDWKRDIESDIALVVALDDPLADLQDLTLGLMAPQLEQHAITADETSAHQWQIAHLVRNIARVQVPESEWSFKIDEENYIEFEQDLHNYLIAWQEHENALLQQGSGHFSVSLDYLKKQKLLESKALLKEKWDFTPSSAHEAQWSQKRRFNDEIRWDELNQFSAKIESQMAKSEAKIQLWADVLTQAVSQFGGDPMRLWLDIETPMGISLYLNLMSEICSSLLQAMHSENERTKLSRLLQRDDNLLALAPFGGSQHLKSALDKDTVDNSIFTGVSDWASLVNRISDFEVLFEHKEITDSRWFKALTEPVQNTLLALRQAVRQNVSESWHNIVVSITPLQRPNGLVPGLLSDIRTLFLESRLHDQHIEFDKNYRNSQQNFNTKLRQAIFDVTSTVHTSPTSPTVIYSHAHQSRRAKQSLINVIADYPSFMAVKNNEVSKQTRAAIKTNTQALAAQAIHGKTTLATHYGNLGGTGAMVAILNSINFLGLMSEIEKLPSDSKVQRQAMEQAAIGFMWALSSIGDVVRSQTFKKLQSEHSSLLKYSIREAIKLETTTQIQKQLLTSFRAGMYTMAITGFIAAGWEVVNIFEHWKNTDSLSERSLLLIKGSGLGANILVFGITIFNTSSQYSIAAIIAPWMVTALFWGGLVVLIASLLLSIIKKSPIEKWLVRCLWGNENRNWSIEKELSEYQKIIYQPQAKIIKSNRQCIRQPVYNSPGLYSIHKTIQIQLPDSSMNFALTISGQTTNTILNGRWVTHQEQRYFEVDISYTSAYANITISLQYTDIPFFNYTLSASKQGGFIIASTVPANQQNLIELQASL